MIAKPAILGLIIATSILVLSQAPPTATAAESWITFKSADLSFDYPISGGTPSAKKVKASPLANPDDKPDGVAPAHWELSFSKSAGKIWIIPTSEVGNKKFHDSYPTVDDAVKDLSPLLKSKTAAPKEIPYLPWADWSSPFNAKVRYISAKNANMVRFIAEYQIEPDVISNDRLNYIAQGLSSDGKYYISVNMPVKAAFLPQKSELPKWSKEKIEKFTTDFPKYIADTKVKLEKLADKDYTPSLIELDKMVQSISLKK